MSNSVQNALLTIIILQLLGEIIETLQYIFAQSAYVPDFLEFLFEVRGKQIGII